MHGKSVSLIKGFVTSVFQRIRLPDITNKKIIVFQRKKGSEISQTRKDMWNLSWKSAD